MMASEESLPRLRSQRNQVIKCSPNSCNHHHNGEHPQEQLLTNDALGKLLRTRFLDMEHYGYVNRWPWIDFYGSLSWFKPSSWLLHSTLYTLNMGLWYIVETLGDCLMGIVTLTSSTTSTSSPTLEESILGHPVYSFDAFLKGLIDSFIHASSTSSHASPPSSAPHATSSSSISTPSTSTTSSTSSSSSRRGRRMRKMHFCAECSA